MQGSDWRNRIFMELDTAALVMGVSKRHIRRVVATEGIPVMRLGRKSILLTNDLVKWEKRRKARDAD